MDSNSDATADSDPESASGVAAADQSVSDGDLGASDDDQSEPDDDWSDPGDDRIDVDLDWGDYIAMTLALAQTVLLPFLLVIFFLAALLVLTLVVL